MAEPVNTDDVLQAIKRSLDNKFDEKKVCQAAKTVQDIQGLFRSGPQKACIYASLVPESEEAALRGITADHVTVLVEMFGDKFAKSPPMEVLEAIRTPLTAVFMRVPIYCQKGKEEDSLIYLLTQCLGEELQVPLGAEVNPALVVISDSAKTVTKASMRKVFEEMVGYAPKDQRVTTRRTHLQKLKPAVKKDPVVPAPKGTKHSPGAQAPPAGPVQTPAQPAVSHIAGKPGNKVINVIRRIRGRY